MHKYIHAASRPSQFPAHSSSFDIHKRDLNGQINRFLKCWLQFSLVPIYGRLANKNIWHSAMISSVLAMSPFGRSSIIREKKTGYIGSRLLLQHFSTLLGREQPRYWHLLNHLTGCSKPLLMSCGSECLRVVILLRWKDLESFSLTGWPWWWLKSSVLCEKDRGQPGTAVTCSALLNIPHFFCDVRRSLCTAKHPPSEALNITSTFLFFLHNGMTHSWLHHNSMGHAGVMWQVCENSMKARDWQAFRRMCTVLTKLCFIMCNILACPPLRNDLQRSKRDYWQHLLLLSDEDFICFCNYNNPS